MIAIRFVLMFALRVRIVKDLEQVRGGGCGGRRGRSGGGERRRG